MNVSRNEVTAYIARGWGLGSVIIYRGMETVNCYYDVIELSEKCHLLYCTQL